MAKQSNFKKIPDIKDTEGSNFGHYSEGVGGGASPKPKDPNQRAPGVNSEHRKEHNNTNQPRTQDGKFSYKSLNGQETKYPGRGKTVNPLLTGGQNGIKIEDAEQQFSEHSGSLWDKYKDKWYQKGSEKITQVKGKLKTKVSAEAIWNIAKQSFDIKNNELTGESHVFDESKSGAPSKEEKIAKQAAQKEKAEKYVISQENGGIKVLKSHAAPAPTKSVPVAPTTQPSPIAPSAPQPAPEQEVQAQPAPEQPAPGTQPWGKSGKFTLKDKEDFINQAKAEFPDFDPNFWTDDTIEEFLLDDLNAKNQNK